jgi:hypothetical protein
MRTFGMEKKSKENSASREEKLASLKVERELLENENALEAAKDAASSERLRHDKRIAWAGVIGRPVMVVVAALAAYCGVDRHAQIAADEELALKKFELETTLRYSIIKDYLALPNETSRSRLDMLSFIEETDDRAGVKAWAKKRREELQKAVTDQAEHLQRMIDSLPSVPGARAPAPTDWRLICTVVAPPLTPGDDPLTTTNLEGSTVEYTDEQAEAKCRSLAERQCRSRSLDLSRCTYHYEKVAPIVPAHP